LRTSYEDGTVESVLAHALPPRRCARGKVLILLNSNKRHRRCDFNVLQNDQVSIFLDNSWLIAVHQDNFILFVVVVFIVVGLLVALWGWAVLPIRVKRRLGETGTLSRALELVLQRALQDSQVFAGIVGGSWGEDFSRLDH
jgi:hypothetical protein